MTYFRFDVAGQHFALPFTNVERIELYALLKSIPNLPANILGLLDYHGQAIPVFDLQCRMGRPVKPFGVSARLVIGHTSTRAFAVAAHAVIGPFEAPQDTISALEPVLPGAARLPAVASTSDGLIFIQDPELLLTAAEQADLDKVMGEPA